MKDRETQRRNQREWRQRRRAEWIAANGPCRRCNSTENLELDHINPSTKVSHRIWTWSEARRERELKKCQVLCHSCHLAKTADEARKRFATGEWVPPVNPMRTRKPQRMSDRKRRAGQLEHLRLYWQSKDLLSTNSITTP